MSNARSEINKLCDVFSVKKPFDTFFVTVYGHASVRAASFFFAEGARPIRIFINYTFIYCQNSFRGLRGWFDVAARGRPTVFHSLWRDQTLLARPGATTIVTDRVEHLHRIIARWKTECCVFFYHALSSRESSSRGGLTGDSLGQISIAGQSVRPAVRYPRGGLSWVRASVTSISSPAATPLPVPALTDRNQPIFRPTMSISVRSGKSRGSTTPITITFYKMT